MSFFGRVQYSSWPAFAGEGVRRSSGRHTGLLHISRMRRQQQQPRQEPGLCLSLTMARTGMEGCITPKAIGLRLLPLPHREGAEESARFRRSNPRGKGRKGVGGGRRGQLLNVAAREKVRNEPGANREHALLTQSLETMHTGHCSQDLGRSSVYTRSLYRQGECPRGGQQAHGNRYRHNATAHYWGNGTWIMERRGESCYVIPATIERLKGLDDLDWDRTQIGWAKKC